MRSFEYRRGREAECWAQGGGRQAFEHRGPGDAEAGVTARDVQGGGRGCGLAFM